MIIQRAYCSPPGIGGEIYLAATAFEEVIHSFLVSRYCGGNETLYAQRSANARIAQLPTVLNAAAGSLEGKTVLDLGCGTVNSVDSSSSVLFEPWLCRILHHSGIKVIGVDGAASVLNEEFPAHCADLMRKDLLSFLSPGSVDIAHAYSLFDSPSLYRRWGQMAGSRLHKLLLPQLEQVVKPEGVFVYESLF